MCGINGIYAYHDAANLPDLEELIATRDHMRARGPDGAGEWWDNERRIGFAHRRLAIIDLSERAAQPMVSADSRYVITFNGEIYNHPELRRELEQRGVLYRSDSDTETLLHLFAQEGAGMVRRLRGMFAFAIWDALEKTLFLARDPYGIKPLYYANDGWTFRFASQVKALQAGGAVSRDPEPAGLVGFHLWGHVPEPFTLFQDIRAVPAGHTMLVDRRGPRPPQRYHSIAKILADKQMETHPGTKEERALQIRVAVRDSVRHHLLSDVEVGVFLSAGVDSGAMLGLVSELGGQPPRAITLSFEEFRGTSEDEAPLAAIVAAQYGATHIVRHVGEAEFRTDLPAIFEAMDQPSIDGVNTWFVAKAARESGLKVAISGLGGDELLAGYNSFLDVPRWHRRFGLLARVPMLGWLSDRAMRVFMPELLARQPKSAHILRYADTWAGAYMLKRGLYLPPELTSHLDIDLVREGMRRLKPLQRLSASLQPDPGSDNGRLCALESSHYMRDQLLRDADWAGMAHSLEIRTPLVDAGLLADLAGSIAGLEAGEGKRALADAPDNPVPSAITDRAKTGFGVPTANWMNPPAGRVPQGRQNTEQKGNTSRLWAKEVISA